jgi:hypothetical protein
MENADITMFPVLVHVGKLGINIVFATKMFLNLLGNIFASQEANFYFGNNVSKGE